MMRCCIQPDHGKERAVPRHPDRYDVEAPIHHGKILLTRPRSSLPSRPFICRTCFHRSWQLCHGNLLPNIPKEKDVLLKGVMTSSGTSSRTVADKYGFEFCTSTRRTSLAYRDQYRIHSNRHDSHAAYVKKALEAGKHVFVENRSASGKMNFIKSMKR